MNKSEFVKAVARKAALPEDQVEKTLRYMVMEITDKLRGDEKVTIAGLGRFEMRQHQSKSYTNPKTRVKSQLEPRKAPAFKAGSLFRSRVCGENSDAG